MNKYASVYDRSRLRNCAVYFTRNSRILRGSVPLNIYAPNACTRYAVFFLTLLCSTRAPAIILSVRRYERYETSAINSSSAQRSSLNSESRGPRIIFFFWALEAELL